MRRLSPVPVAAFFVLVGSVGPSTIALAQETGLHKLHTIARSGSLLCMTEHEHYGETTPPAATPTVAKSIAIKRWNVFTADEYGAAWGSYALAAGKRETCSGASPNIVCKVTARPCRSMR
jgi:hypothetical protein